MSMKRSILLTIALALVLGIFLYVYFFKQKEDSNNEIPQNPITSEDFTLEKEYISENTWEFKITGQFPNPCYSATVETVIAESYPEQVTITVNIIEPSKDIVCIQVISPFEYEGTFSASQQALITLNIKE